MKQRSAVNREDCWNVEDLYPSLDAWQKDFDKQVVDQRPRWPKIASYKGQLGKNASTLKNAIVDILTLDRQLSKLYTYVHLRHDEEITEDAYKSALKRILVVIQDFQQEVSWFEPELLALSDEKIAVILNDPVLKDYKFYLEKIVRLKEHTLPAEQEELIAMTGQALQSSHKAFSAINDADFKFGTITDSNNKSHELTHATYALHLRDRDRTLRKNAFTKMHEKYQEFENSLCELLNGETQAHHFYARAKRYKSCLEAALFPKNIDVEVYHSLIQAVQEEIGALHRYMALRKKILKLDKLYLYDLSVPLTAQLDINLPYTEAEDLILESVAPLGADYQNILHKGFKQDRWVDRYENKNKRSGAYSSGCYDSMPYILMNYKDLLRDVFTLAHEAGHSMHSYLSHHHQPYQYGDYPIFLAEVASTFNEELLIRLMLQRAKNKEEKIYLLTQKLEDIRTTLFRQTLFAEFELFIHTRVENNEPLTPKVLHEEMGRLTQFYSGPGVVVDDVAKAEWARIPHFYYNFYVYQYATGISAALALADRVLSGGKQEREDYLNFLKGGSSRYPIEMLKVAGVDMRTVQPVKAAIKKFDTLVKEIEKLV